MTKKQKSHTPPKQATASAPVAPAQPLLQVQQISNPDPINQFGTSMPQQKISKGLLWAIGIGFAVMNLVFLAFYIWADYYEHPDEYKAVSESTGGSVDPVILVIAMALGIFFVMLPTLIIALVVWLKLRKKK